MSDLKDLRWIYAKGFLFLLAGVLSAALLIIESPSLKVAALLGLSIWCFARFYYFAFYVIEHYVDSQYRFAGLTAFARYLWQQQRDRGGGSGQLLAETRHADGKDRDTAER